MFWGTGVDVHANRAFTFLAKFRPIKNSSFRTNIVTHKSVIVVKMALTSFSASGKNGSYFAIRLK
jgi:hypothetical protein